MSPIFSELSWDWLTVHLWFFLIVGVILAAVLLFFDHGETWQSVMNSEGKERILAIIKLSSLWGLMTVTTLSGIGAIITADEQAAQIENLELASKPRHVLQAQNDAFKASLAIAGKANIPVAVGAQDSETAEYAEEIRQMLTNAGFFSPIVGQEIAVPYPKFGVTIVTNLDPSSNNIQLLQNAFKTAGITVSIYPSQQSTEVFILVFVGGKLEKN